jgi:FKBP-type peptidyl-prolyl cis-trans isomerase FkpA
MTGGSGPAPPVSCHNHSGRLPASYGVRVRLARVCPPAFVFVALLVVSALAGCSHTPTAPSSYAPFGKTDLVVGTGAAAISGSVVTVNFTGWLYNGSMPEKKGASFATTLGGQPFTFTLGAGAVIKGWDEGIPGMNVGGLRRLVIPPSLAYGGTRTSAIPPNATLIFEVELVSVQ